MLGFCFRVYVRRSQGAGTDPAKDRMPRACPRGQGLPSDLPKESLSAFGCYWLYVRRSQGLWDDPAQDSMPRACRRELDVLKYPILSVLRKGTDFLQTQWVMCMALPTCRTRKRVPLSSPGHAATKYWMTGRRWECNARMQCHWDKSRIPFSPIETASNADSDSSFVATETLG